MQRVKCPGSMRLRMRLSTTLCVIAAVIACSENTESQQRDNQRLWPALAAEPVSAIELIHFGPQQAPSKASDGLGAVLSDIISHLPVDYGSKFYSADLSAWGHATSQGIHEHLSRRYNTTGRKAAAYYLLHDKAAVLAQPKMLKSRLAEFIPADMQGDLYGRYVSGESVWEDTPLQVLDGLFAHINGVATALDEKNATQNANRSSLVNLIEFVPYSVALAMAVQKYDPQYFTANHQFTAVLALGIERALLLYHLSDDKDGLDSTSDDQAARMFHNLMAAESGEAMRDFLQQLFGSDWLRRVAHKPENIGPKQRKDISSLLKATLPQNADPDSDGDNDRIPDRLDRCPNSSGGDDAKVWTYGEWIGCAEGEQRL